ncbi:hypothetical protein AA313_de0204184 [Arthrobotrys entomopaga]|nr:hypothetical protein AA313_de0204184 [Arthrobotrys entomopaga]
MYWSISIATTLLSILVPEVSAHARALEVWGDIGSNKPYSYAITGVPVGGNYIYPHQFDTTVFSSPLIPNPKVPRVWLSQGCGSTLGNLDAWAARTQPAKYKGVSVDTKVWWWYSQYLPNDITAYTVQNDWTSRYAKAGQLPQCSQGGTLTWKIYTVNQDGAGPFRCRIDTTGSGAHFGAWLPINPKYQVPPLDPNLYSVSYERVYQLGYVQVQIPADTVCKGSFGGVDNICIMRCENYAVNGPFGGCMAFELRNKDGSKFGVKTTKVAEVTTKIIENEKTKTVVQVTTKTVVSVPSQIKATSKVTAVPTETANPGYPIDGGEPEYYKKRYAAPTFTAAKEKKIEKRETHDYFEKRAYNPYKGFEKREAWEPQVSSEHTERDAKLFRRAQAEHKPSLDEMLKANQVKNTMVGAKIKAEDRVKQEKGKHWAEKQAKVEEQLKKATGNETKSND